MSYETKSILQIKSIDIGEVSKGLEYGKEGYEIVKDYPDGDQNKNVINYLIAKGVFIQKDYSKALEFSSTAMEGFKISGETKGLDYIEALDIYGKALMFSNKLDAALTIFDLRDSLKASRNTETQKAEIAAAEVKFRIQEQEAEFKAIEQAQQLQIARAEGRQNLFLSLLGAALLALLLGIYFYRRVESAKKEVEKQKALVDQSLVEKEVLLKEIHHRVKNNLQIISSLLDEQARKASDTLVKKMMKEGQDRVQSMALIHQNLYESSDLSGIVIKDYLVELTKNIAYSQANQEKVAIELDVDDSTLDIDTAIPIGLILNELITNCFKYAFAGKDSGKISIAFNKTNDHHFVVKVADNGVGLPNDFDIRKAKSLGLNLVRGLVRQLGGTMNFTGTNEGTRFELQLATRNPQLK